MSRRQVRLLIAAGVAFVVLAVTVGVIHARNVDAVRPTVDPVAAQRIYDQADDDVVPGRHYTKVAAIGDSYTGGSAMGGQDISGNWIATVVAQLRGQGRYVEISRAAAGGSGWVERGPKNTTIPDLVDDVVTNDTEILIAFGSRNDADSAGVAEAASKALAEARRISPDIRFLVIGPPWIDEDVPAGISADRDAVRLAADGAGAAFVDPLAERWFFGADSRLIGRDAIHPTVDGHRYMGARIAPHLAALVPAQR